MAAPFGFQPTPQAAPPPPPPPQAASQPQWAAPSQSYNTTAPWQGGSAASAAPSSAGGYGGSAGGAAGVGFGGGGGGMGGDMMVSQQSSAMMGGAKWDDDDEDEPPLLEGVTENGVATIVHTTLYVLFLIAAPFVATHTELGINWSHIWSKMGAVLVPNRELTPEVLEDTDFAGPLVFCIALGFCLLLVRRREPYIHEMNTQPLSHTLHELLCCSCTVWQGSLWLHLWHFCHELHCSVCLQQQHPPPPPLPINHTPTSQQHARPSPLPPQLLCPQPHGWRCSSTHLFW